MMDFGLSLIYRNIEGAFLCIEQAKDYLTMKDGTVNFSLAAKELIDAGQQLFDAEIAMSRHLSDKFDIEKARRLIMDAIQSAKEKFAKDTGA